MMIFHLKTSAGSFWKHTDEGIVMLHCTDFIKVTLQKYCSECIKFFVSPTAFLTSVQKEKRMFVLRGELILKYHHKNIKIICFIKARKK